MSAPISRNDRIRFGIPGSVDAEQTSYNLVWHKQPPHFGWGVQGRHLTDIEAVHDAIGDGASACLSKPVARVAGFRAFASRGFAGSPEAIDVHSQDTVGRACVLPL